MHDRRYYYAKRLLSFAMLFFQILLAIVPASLLFFQLKSTQSLSQNFTTSAELPRNHDELLGGLLVAGFDERSCLSRYMSHIYGKSLSEKPSSYLISKLRNYESLHKKCGPHTESYNQTVKELISGHYSGSSSSSSCKYVVWIPLFGLGNRILTLVSSFLYSLLTNRVLLVHPRANIGNLFCEPFPNTSWVLPSDFPLTTNHLYTLNKNSARCYGQMLRKNSISNSTNSVPSYVYLYLLHDYQYHDRLFFCENDQSYLQSVPWLIIRSDNYFIPSFFLMSSFEQELNLLFPKKDTIFHFLGRYLFHPTNNVWGLITRYYDAYLAKADERIGIQIRVFYKGTSLFQIILDQILSCVLKEKLLPNINKNQEDDVISSSKKQKSKAVLMTSLDSGYYEKFRDMYWEYPTENGDLISVHQPSNEVNQQTDTLVHDQKALAEMYLLSFSDVLITSSRSTFGYVAQGFGGLKPWLLLYKPGENQTLSGFGCQRVMEMEPCFHDPTLYDCKNKRMIDKLDIVPHLRHCVDVSKGIKVVDA